MLQRLTEEELLLVSNPDIIRTKNRIIQEIATSFGTLAERYKVLLSSISPANIPNINAKISKGEQYQGLPYVILDYPRSFEKNNVFAVRSFFWWGNFFSITLHLSGAWKEKYHDALQQSFETGKFRNWYINASDEQWHHHFEPENYLPIGEIKTTRLHELSVIKLAIKIPLQEWDNLEIFFIENFTTIINALSF